MPDPQNPDAPPDASGADGDGLSVTVSTPGLPLKGDVTPPPRLPPPSPMDLEGRQLGEFEILELLGRGGMGAVYKARQISLDRIVAIKTLQSMLAGDERYIARFRQEAKAAALLNHPNLVQVYSAGESAGQYWFAMEYVGGESAKARLKRKGRLNAQDAITIALHVANALDYGWRKASLIHRDVKPDNIFLSGEGEVKLGDLGLAKSLDQNQELTATGASMGTPVYISPEQVMGAKEADLRTDIYSLGCTLYHLVSGQPPYAAESATALMMKHVSAPVPDLRSVWHECPPELAAAVSKMMQKQPADRQQSYDEVSADLQRAHHEISDRSVPSLLDVTQTPAAVKKKRAVPASVWVIGAGVLCAAVGAMLFFAPWKHGGQSRKTDGSGAMASSGSTQSLPPPAPTRSAEPSIDDKPTAVAPNASPKVKPPAKRPDPVNRMVASPSNPQIARVAVNVPAATAAPTPAGNVAKASPKPAETAQAAPIPKSEIQKWLDQVDAQFQEPYEREVIKPYEAGMAQLKQAYLASVDRLLNAATQAAELEDAMALRAERKLVEEGPEFPEDDLDGPPPPIKSLRASYRAQAVKLDRSRAQGAEAQFDRYDKVLATGQAQLTQRQRLDDAMLLKLRRERLASEWLGKPLPSGAASGAGRTASSVAPASISAPFVNTLGMKFVPVPIVGEATQVPWLLFSVFDTRVQDYSVFAGQTHRDWPATDFPQGPTHPAVMVSWEDAQRFCEWLTTRERAVRRLPADWRYRLPSDHEWSCAVEIGAREDATEMPAAKTGILGDLFPWGSAWPPPAGAGNYAGIELRPALAAGKYTYVTDVIAGYNDRFVETSPAGSFKANQFGLCDMGGNVWQWCENLFEKGQKDRVLRGASWSDYDRAYLLSSCRLHFAPEFRNAYNGFRCVVGASAH